MAGSNKSSVPRSKEKVLSSPWRVVNLAMAVFFTLASVANVNDGDWYIWMPMYMVPALLCLSVALKPFLIDNQVWKLITLSDFLVCVVYGLYQVYAMTKALSGNVENPLMHEEGREMVGLLIILAWAGVSRFAPLGSGKSSNQNMMLALLWLTTTLAVLPLVTWSICFVGDWHKRLGHCNGMFVH